MSELTRSDPEASLIIHHLSFIIRSIDEFIYSDAMHALPLISLICYVYKTCVALPLLSLSLSPSLIPYIPRHEQRSKCHQTLASNSSIIKLYIAHLNAHNENSDSLILATMKCFPWGPGTSLVIRLFQRSQLTRCAPSHTQDVFPE